MKLYRECYTNSGGQAATFGETETLRTTVPGFNTITMYRTIMQDISPICNANFTPNIYCPGMIGATANMGALQEFIYTSDGSFPNGVPLTGTPPATGWIFYNESCCRNPSTNVTNSNYLSWRLRAVMYPYTPPGSSIPLPADPCYDSSPIFAERPSTVICLGYPFVYNHNTYDSDLDSIAYAWGHPLLSGGANIVSYAPDFSAGSPLPGISHNPNNIPSIVNPHTGEISFTSFTQGAFITSTKVSTYRNGQLIAEINREMQVVLIACGNIATGQANNPPIVIAPFPQNSFNSQVYAGQAVSFNLTANDFEMMPGGTIPQTITLTASGGQFGYGFTNPNAGCAFPPCATLTPPPPMSAQFAISSDFNWQTNCDHLTANNSNSTSRIYYFNLSAKDDFCPSPAITHKIISIEVMDTPPLEAPQITCIETLNNGNVVLNWITPADPIQTPTFKKYIVYHTPNLNIPFTAVDTITDYLQTSWTHNVSNGLFSNGFYYINTLSGCLENKNLIPGNTKRNIFLQATPISPSLLELTWNNPNHPASSTNDNYYIYKDDGLGNFLLYDSVTTLSFVDTFDPLGQVSYKIVHKDSLNCESVSNIDGFPTSDIFDANSKFNIYPIPFNDELNICEFESYENIKVVLYDIYGKEIMNKNFTKENCIRLNTQTLTNGLYLLKINIKDKTYSRKVLKIGE